MDTLTTNIANGTTWITTDSSTSTGTAVGWDTTTATWHPWGETTAVKTDPVIFCRTRRDMIKSIKKLLKRPEVDKKSIRIFALVGGAKKAITR